MFRAVWDETQPFALALTAIVLGLVLFVISAVGIFSGDPTGLDIVGVIMGPIGFVLGGRRMLEELIYG